MIGQGVLGQIANPQMADIAGALDVREARIQRDEQRRKEIRMGQLISQAIPNLKEGSPLYQMALENPSGFMQFSKAAGIPLNDGERIQQFANDTTMLYQLAQQDPKDAYEWAVSTANERRQAGIEPVQLEKFIAGMRDDPVRTITGLTLTYRNVGDQQPNIQSSKTLPGGLTQMITRDGNVVVKDASGRVIEGDEAVKAVQAAEQRGIDQQRSVYAAREEGKLGTKLELEPTLTDRNIRAKGEAENVTKTQKEYFDQLQNIDSNIQNYAEGIRLLREEGANTGVVTSRLPSLKAASVKLDNLRNRLGLDVVGSTTFGALSEAELAMALDTALPKNLQPEQMAVWLEERMMAQQKLRGVLDNALQYLSIPGNTLSDLREAQREGAAQPAQSKAVNWSDL